MLLIVIKVSLWALLLFSAWLQGYATGKWRLWRRMRRMRGPRSVLIVTDRIRERDARQAQAVLSNASYRTVKREVGRGVEVMN